MSLEDEIKRFLDRRAGIPWILRVKVEEIPLSELHKVSEAELLHGHQIEIAALTEAVLMLARAIDEGHKRH